MVETYDATSRVALFSLPVLALLISCSSKPAKSTCTSEANPDGGATIVCGDGTTIAVKNGEPGTSCTVTDNGNGTSTLACDDGTSTVVTSGADGTSCTVTANADGTKTIQCEDGTSATVSDGTDGTSCTASVNPDGTKTISCDDGTSVTVSPSGDPNDVSAPTTVALPTNHAFRDTVTVSLLCSDAGSGCQATYFTLDGSTPTSASFQYNAPLVLTDTTTVKFFSIDNAANAEAPSTITFLHDDQPPTTVTSPAGGPFGGTLELQFDCDDAAGSGCLATYFTLDGSAPSTLSLQYVAGDPAEPIFDTTTVRYFSVDAAGNIEPLQETTFVLDTTPPTTTLSVAGGTYKDAQTVSLSCDDGDGTGCAAIFYSTDPTASAAEFLAYSTAIAVDASAVLRFYSVDGAGNAEEIQSAIYVIDHDPPLATASPTGGWNRYTYQSITLSCDDGAGSGCEGIYYTTDGTPPTTSSAKYTGTPVTLYATAGGLVLQFIAVDSAGNESNVYSETYLYDGYAPTVTYTVSNGTVFSTSTDVELTCTDSQSGCDAIYYTTDGTYPSSSADQLYSGPVTISSTLQIRWIAYDNVGRTSSTGYLNLVLDTAAPVITGSLPVDGEPWASLTPEVYVDFDEAIDSTSVTSSYFQIVGVPATVQYASGSSTRIQLIPQAPLAADTTYTIEVAAGVKDLLGNATSQASTLSFTTRRFGTPLVNNARPQVTLQQIDFQGDTDAAVLTKTLTGTAALVHRTAAAAGPPPSWGSARELGREVNTVFNLSGGDYLARQVASNSGYLVAYQDGTDVILERTEGGVLQHTSTLADVTISNLALATDGTGYMVLWRTTGTATSAPMQARNFAAGTWSADTAVDSLSGIRPSDVSAAGAAGRYAVGAVGTMTFYTGTLWTPLAIVASGSFPPQINVESNGSDIMLYWQGWNNNDPIQAALVATDGTFVTQTIATSYPRFLDLAPTSTGFRMLYTESPAYRELRVRDFSTGAWQPFVTVILNYASTTFLGGQLLGPEANHVVYERHDSAGDSFAFEHIAWNSTDAWGATPATVYSTTYDKLPTSSAYGRYGFAFTDHQGILQISFLAAGALSAPVSLDLGLGGSQKSPLTAVRADGATLVAYTQAAPSNYSGGASECVAQTWQGQTPSPPTVLGQGNCVEVAATDTIFAVHFRTALYDPLANSIQWRDRVRIYSADTWLPENVPPAAVGAMEASSAELALFWSVANELHAVVWQASDNTWVGDTFLGTTYSNADLRTASSGDSMMVTYRTAVSSLASVERVFNPASSSYLWGSPKSVVSTSLTYSDFEHLGLGANDTEYFLAWGNTKTNTYGVKYHPVTTQVYDGTWHAAVERNAYWYNDNGRVAAASAGFALTLYNGLGIQSVWFYSNAGSELHLNPDSAASPIHDVVPYAAGLVVTYDAAGELYARYYDGSTWGVSRSVWADTPVQVGATAVARGADLGVLWSAQTTDPTVSTLYNLTLPAAAVVP